MIPTIAGTPEQFTMNNLELASGGQVFRDAFYPLPGVTPAWRISYLNNIVARVSSVDTPQSVLDEKQHDITYVQVSAMKKLAPNTGAYMNERVRFDPDWKVDFYGRRYYSRLLAVKRRYNSHGLFYCPTDVGSDAFGVVPGADFDPNTLPPPFTIFSMPRGQINPEHMLPIETYGQPRRSWRRAVVLDDQFLQDLEEVKPEKHKKPKRASKVAYKRVD
ncbi:hypothetical protein AYL99_11589 [Fonsecaea erecta]|uniref:Berberine/berberine-like domain-containing protein n=1 Tax=Fonsecaea erecta TaxID=1367422 RepID=A0A178Z4N9_9EURO|nr:hypothetical protein AYL99_11589 [Fonsecaea erecta]OAP54055.1 hypothetical protein AYL99_11589 [Fonsecaea erecta]